MTAAIQGYRQASAELIPQFEAISSDDLYNHARHLLPQGKNSVLDIGAGTGRDAAWFAERGQSVLAVEPAKELREAGITLHQSPRIYWLDDSLPTLTRTLQRGEKFDLILLSAVWQHLDEEDRRVTLPNLRRLTRPKGRLIISLRHGPGSPARPCFEAHPEHAIDLAIDEGFQLIFKQSTESIQTGNRTAGVTWTWLAFTADH